MPSRAHRQESEKSSLRSFVEGIVGEDRLRVEEDLGQGFVRLKSSEAERRQAAQDIRSSEDIVLEMLRNARDAGASNAFVAMGREGGTRTIVVVDDGEGIPPEMHGRVFQPRVTSKLDSAKLDKWGIHGRGMALYSISANSEYSQVQRSIPGRGTSIKVRTDTAKLPERADQSTFPHFERTDSGFAMRGPKNILRTVAEFAFEHRETMSVYCGSDTEMVASLYDHGTRTLSAAKRLFRPEGGDVLLTQEPSMSSDERELAGTASMLGIEISERSARRILDGEIAPAPSMMERLESEAFPHGARETNASEGKSGPGRPVSSFGHARTARMSKEDLRSFEADVSNAFGALADKYYLRRTPPTTRRRGSKLVVEFDLIEEDS